MQVTVANRLRSAALLQAVLPTLPEQQELERKRAKASEDIVAFILLMRDLKRQAKHARREAERQSALEALHESGADGPKSVRQRRSVAGGRSHNLAGGSAVYALGEDDSDDDEDDGNAGVLLRGAALVDPWSIEGDDPLAALCAVCGDGTSYDGNPVMFCERCNVPVHQHCYGVKNVPEGEWLCWPCVM
jgi:hypothetical protein